MGNCSTTSSYRVWVSLCQTSSFESNFSLCLRLLAHHTNWMGSHKIPVMQVFKNIIDRLHHCNHRRSLPNVFRLDKVSKVGQGDFNFSSHQQSVQNFKLEAASLMANSHAHIYFYKDWQRENKVFKTSNWKQLLLWPMAKDFCATSMTKGKLFSLEMHFKQATIVYVSGIPW